MTVPTPGPPVSRTCGVVRFDPDGNYTCEKLAGHPGAHLYVRPSVALGGRSGVSIPKPQPVTVDDMLRNPARLHRRVAEYSEARNIFQALGIADVETKPLTRRERLRRAVDDRLSNARTWLALRIAPWLNNDQDW